MIQLIAKTEKNVKVNFYGEECFVTYIICTSQNYGVYKSTIDDKQYDVYTIRNFKSISKNYARYTEIVKLQGKNFMEMQSEINKVYYSMKKKAMIDARKSKLVDLVVKSSKRVRTISKLQKEIEILEALETGKPFGQYILTEKYQHETKCMDNFPF